MLSTALLIAALILAILATIGIPAGRYSLIAAALACYFASLLLGGVSLP